MKKLSFENTWIIRVLQKYIDKIHNSVHSLVILNNFNKCVGVQMIAFYIYPYNMLKFMDVICL